LAQRKPGAIGDRHGGNGTAMHLTAQIVHAPGGINMTLVPYRGTGPATQDLVAGQSGWRSPTLQRGFAHSIETIKVLAVTTKERFEAMPDCRPWTGGLSATNRSGGSVRRAGGTPAESSQAHGAIVAALKDPGMLERTAPRAIPMPFSPAEFARYIRSEYEKWQRSSLRLERRSRSATFQIVAPNANEPPCR